MTRWTADQHDAWKAREAARANDQRAKADAAKLTDAPGAQPPMSASAGRPVPQAASGEASSAPIYPLVGLCRAAGLPEPVPEYRWHPVRKFRADYAFPLHRVLIEIDGGLWVNGGHSRGAARMHDMAKDRAATLLGWRTLRYAPTELTAIISDLRILLAGDQCANSL